MDCHELIELLSDFLDEELDKDMVEEVRAHVEECPFCGPLCQSMQTTIRMLSFSEEKYILPQRVRQRLRKRLVIYSRTIKYKK